MIMQETIKVTTDSPMATKTRQPPDNLLPCQFLHPLWSEPMGQLQKTDPPARYQVELIAHRSWPAGAQWISFS
jgi:hypothetical protein